MKNKQFYVTEKLDGSSATFYLYNGEFGVCSRNIDLEESEDNRFWQMARQYDIENKLKSIGGNIAIQGELIGLGVQGNKYKLDRNVISFFNIYHIDMARYGELEIFKSAMNETELPFVPILDDKFSLPETLEELLKYAEGKSVLNKDTEREGVVIRSHDRTISFKVISNKFLLNEK
jgi:RNA ligase (TIGR02306 family)